MQEANKINQEVKEVSKIGFLTAVMRRTESSSYGTDRKLMKKFAQRMHP
jgi:hypothetical protein